MKLLGRTNGKIVVASMAHRDYVAADGLMMDGGQPTTNHYAGYNRYSQEGRVITFEVPQTFAELFTDYQTNKERKYGIWNIEDVRILPDEEWPDITSMEEKAQNFIWWNRGLSGREPVTYTLLKDCSISHLKAILTHVSNISQETKQVIEYLISKNNSRRTKK